MTTGPLGDNNLDLPFEKGPDGQTMDVSNARLSGGVVTLAIVVPTPVGPMPAIMFRFAAPDGQFIDPILLVMDDTQARNLPGLIYNTVSAARQAARG